MAKAKQEQVAKPARQKQSDTAALQAELKSFASGLGFAAGGPSSGFDDADFRPPAAGERSKPSSSARQPTHIKASKGLSTLVPGHRTKPIANKAAQPPASAEQQRETPDVVRERNWNAGVGARPGVLLSPCSNMIFLKTPPVCCLILRPAST